MPARKKKKPDVYGLVLCGGKSTRMGKDKGQLIYGDMPQLQRCFELLEPVCKEVFMSCRKEQLKDKVYKKYKKQAITDQFPQMAPMNGICSAFQKHDNVAWLVLACDMPLVDEILLRQIIKARDPQKVVTCFVKPNGEPEPLCTLYEPAAKGHVETSMEDRQYSMSRLVKFLMKDESAEIVPIPHSPSLTSINTHTDYVSIREEALFS